MKSKTHSKRGSKKAAQAESLPLANKGSSWLAEVCNAQVGMAIAIAFVVFAAGSVAGMAALAYPEVSAGNEVSFLATTHHINGQSAVLGDSTTQPVVDDAALEAADPAAYLSAKPVSFDSTLGRWNYTISYSVSNLNGPASLTIGTFVLQSGITASGKVDTGAILKPNMTYHASLWTSSKQNLAHIDIRTGKGKTSSTTKPEGALMPCPASGSLNLSSSTPPTNRPFCVKKDDGSTQCPTPPCIQFQGEKNGGQGDQGGKVPPPLSNSTPPPGPNASSTSLSVLISIPKNVPAGISVQAAAAVDPRKLVSFTIAWGDGTTTSSPQPVLYYHDTHTYTTAGQYTVTATASDGSGNTATKTATITVGPAGSSNAN